jgi:4-alpha-glucanotransferase
VFLSSERSAGVLLPLFSIRSGHGWGVGELTDLGAIAPWMAKAGLSMIMLLPLLEAEPGQTSPYSALSAFALEPAYLDLSAIEDFSELGGVGALPPEDRAALDRARASPRVEWWTARSLKASWLRRSFARFTASGAAANSARARDLAEFRESHADWLPDYLLFRALKEAAPYTSWRSWDEPLRNRAPDALAAARERTAVDRAFFEYVQWQAYRQLAAARKEARRHGVLLVGDLPFMVDLESADTWSRQGDFRFDATIGAPPDALSADGQDWGLPAYRWELLAPAGYPWLRLRGARAAETYDRVRVDHVVGFYRTYVRPRGPGAGPPGFSPMTEKEQLVQGEAIMNALGSGGAGLIAEDLGMVPPFVRASLTLLGIPGFRVLRWEKDGDAFRDPVMWPALSVAATGTHDTDAAAVWWEQLGGGEREALLGLRAFRGLSRSGAGQFSPEVHRAMLEAMYGSGSDLLLMPVQDLLGGRERINLPGTVNPENWTYRMPYSIADLEFEPRARELTAQLADLAHRHRRRGA